MIILRLSKWIDFVPQMFVTSASAVAGAPAPMIVDEDRVAGLLEAEGPVLEVVFFEESQLRLN